MLTAEIVMFLASSELIYVYGNWGGQNKTTSEDRKNWGNSVWQERQRIIFVKHFKEWVYKYHNVKNTIIGKRNLLWRDLDMILISMLIPIQN